MFKICLILAMVVLGGCSAQSELAPPEVHTKATPHGGTARVAVDVDIAAPSAQVMRLWSTSCALCHADGTAGAPRVGDSQAWQARLAKGREALLHNTVAGYARMPPLGYCMACEADDFVSMIEFMAGLDQGDLK